MNDSPETLQNAIAQPENFGEMTDADSVGTVGSPDCGDMVRMWLKFGSNEKGQRVIDKASFQSFGCQTAIAVASVATQMLRGKTAEEARNLSATELSAPLGPLPPMKIHCGQMVEGALRAALEADADGQAVTGASLPAATTGEAPAHAPTLLDRLQPGSTTSGKGIRIVPIED